VKQRKKAKNLNSWTVSRHEVEHERRVEIERISEKLKGEKRK